MKTRTPTFKILMNWLFAIFLCIGAIYAESLEEFTIQHQIQQNPPKESFDNITPLYELRQKAQSGDIIAQISLSRKLYYGVGVPKDINQAAFWIIQAAEQGNAEAQYGAGMVYHKGIGGYPKDYTKALDWLDKSAAQNNVFAHELLGFIYYNGEGVTRNYKKAMRHFLKASELGSTDADSWIAVLYLKNIGPDYEKAIEWANKAAEKGNAQGMLLLGWMYDKRQGIKQDDTKALQYYLQAAEKNNISAQFNAGVFYYTGSGCEQDYQKAFEWFKKAADGGKQEAYLYLGIMYFHGRGVQQDFAQAFKYSLAAAEHGEVQGQYFVGFFYLSGTGVDADINEGIKWLKKAVEQNYADAQCLWAKLHLNGWGFEKNEVEALAWYMISAIQGNQEAIENTKNIRSELTEKQLKQAEQRKEELQKQMSGARHNYKSVRGQPVTTYKINEIR